MKGIHLLVVLVSLALSALTANMASAAETYFHSFCFKPIASNIDLETRVNNARAADTKHDGNVKLEGCRVTLNVFVQAVQRDDPAANVSTFADLAQWAHDLTPEKAREGTTYHSDALYEQQDGSFVLAQADAGIDRDLKPGEIVYRSRTGKLGLLSFCANPGVVEVPPIVVRAGCIRYDAPSDAGVETRVAVIGPEPLSDRCIRLNVSAGKLYKGIGELPNECPMDFVRLVNGHRLRYHCDWSQDEARASAYLSQKAGHPVHAKVQNVTASFYGHDGGLNSLWLPTEAKNAIVTWCWTDPKTGHQTIALGQPGEDVVDGVATITRQEYENKKAGRPLRP